MGREDWGDARGRCSAVGAAPAPAAAGARAGLAHPRTLQSRIRVLVTWLPPAKPKLARAKG